MSYPRFTQGLRSPFDTTSVRRDSVTSEVAAGPSSSKMLRIQNLLNPEMPSTQPKRSTSPPPTPASIANNSTAASTPCPDSPQTPDSKSKKPVKDDTAFVRGCPQGDIKFEPFECGTYSTILTASENAELREQHVRFQLYPSGGETGLIREFPKHIPYASAKKGFFVKTGREAFEVFQYTFIVPEDPAQKVHKIMWDYQNGLVRITPFFKACGFSKTTPNKALSTNLGLKDVAHSITGGALLAQGYWVPFQCARAISLTFCYPIRWAMTPIFGPYFIKECLHPRHAAYSRFKIDPQIIRQAQLEAEAWRLEASRSVTPASQSPYTPAEIPRSVPPTSAPATGMDLRPKREKPTFKTGSPFSSDAEQNYVYKRANDSDDDDSLVSPKSSHAAPFTSRTSTRPIPSWTSINRSPPAPPTNTPVVANPQTLRLLTHPNDDLEAQQPSWRGLDGQRSTSPASTGMGTACRPAKQHQGYKRRASESDDEYIDTDSTSSSSNSPVMDKLSNMVTSPPPSFSKRPAKRLRLEQSYREPTEETNDVGNTDVHTTKSTKVSSQEARAALLLLEISKTNGSVDLARRPVGNETYY